MRIRIHRQRGGALGLPGSTGSFRTYEKVTGASAELPSTVQWMKETITPGERDGSLVKIDEWLRAYPTLKDGWDRLAVLGQLYFCSDYYLKSKSNVAPRGKQESAVHNLFLTVVDKLCKAFDCSVNILPEMLEECWGRILTSHGHAVDTQRAPHGAPPKIATYLTRARAEQYRLTFQNGLCYMRDRQKFSRMVLANSAGIGWTYSPKYAHEQMMYPGFAGFALSMSRELYMAHHRGGFAKGNFFHSSYLAGDAVLCTGTIKIEAGVVKEIYNDSGHYQPTDTHLVSVIETLQMHGCDPAKITVYCKAHSWRDDNHAVQDQEAACTGAQLLQWRGLGVGLYQRMLANQENIAHRKKQYDRSGRSISHSPANPPVVNLPARPHRPPPPRRA